MERNKRQLTGLLFRNSRNQVVSVLCILVFISNLNAIVDSFLHPDIPYFDHEHVIVGGITGFVNALLFGLIMLYTRSLEKASSKIRMLESFLPICSHCKKVRIPEADPEKAESWQPLELYISKHTSTELSHGICPACAKEYYPDYVKK